MFQAKSYRGSFNAWLLHFLETHMDRIYGDRKRKVFRGLPAQVVEIGPGTGANLRYYSEGTMVIAIEPNPMMYPRLRANADRYGIELEIRGIKGEEMDLAAGSVEAVVGTLVLCTVDDPKRVVSEVHRILKPGGRYIFLEHVAAPQGSTLSSFQNLLHKPWHWLSGGCNLNRNTHSILWAAGFSSIDMNCFMLKPGFVPITAHIFGMAIR